MKHFIHKAINNTIFLKNKKKKHKKTSNDEVLYILMGSIKTGGEP